MSLINKMLQDLEKRTGGQRSVNPALDAPQGREAPAAHVGSEWFWRVLAAVMLLAVVWVVWLMWELRPRPVVNEVALRMTAPAARISAPPSVRDADVSAPEALAPALATVQTAKEPPAPARIDSLRLSMELATPPVGPPASATRAAGSRENRAAPAVMPAVREPDPAVKTPSQAVPAMQVPPPVSPRIEKRASGSSQERADEEYKRALSLSVIGRLADAIRALRTVLATDPAHDAARLSLAAQLIATKSYDEASQLLNEGLNVNSKNPAFAMSLARLMVERGDVDGALIVLDRHAASASGNADYHAFRAALQQRVSRHAEAIEEYRAALSLLPSVGRWWIGLGISLQAQGRPKEALESYRRAKGTGNLPPELIGFADQRINLLQ